VSAAFLLSASLGATAAGVLTARHYATTGWPLTHGNSWLIAVAGPLPACLRSQGRRLAQALARSERPGSHALAAANAVRPSPARTAGRFDDVVGIAVARRWLPVPASARSASRSCSSA
jgi:hypothetical protein